VGETRRHGRQSEKVSEGQRVKVKGKSSFLLYPFAFLL